MQEGAKSQRVTGLRGQATVVELCEQGGTHQLGRHRSRLFLIPPGRLRPILLGRMRHCYYYSSAPSWESVSVSGDMAG